MSKLSSLLLGVGIVLALSACAPSQNTAATQAAAPAPVDQAAEAAKARLAQQDANIQVVKVFFNPEVTMDGRLSILSADIIQHNPIIVRFAQINNIQNGRDAFREYVETLSKLRGGGAPFALGPPPGPKNAPQPPPVNLLYRVMADGDLVTVIRQRYLPEPGAKGKFYPVYSFDTFRVQDRKLAEHWDGQTIPNPLPIFLREPISKIHFPKQTKPIE